MTSQVQGAGWYKKVFAWLMAQGMAEYEQAVSSRKQALFSEIHGDVLEIGAGAGPNLRYYPKDIHWIGIEPNPYMHPYLQQEAEKLGLNIDIRIYNMLLMGCRHAAFTLTLHCSSSRLIPNLS